jgi:hypothetical protein
LKLLPEENETWQAYMHVQIWQKNIYDGMLSKALKRELRIAGGLIMLIRELII